MFDLNTQPVQRSTGEGNLSSPLEDQSMTGALQQKSGGHFANQSPQVQGALQMQAAANQFVGGNAPRQLRAPMQLFAGDAPLQMRLDNNEIQQLGLNNIAACANVDLTTNNTTNTWHTILTDITPNGAVEGGANMRNWMKLFVALNEIATGQMLSTVGAWLLNMNANDRTGKLDDFLEELQSKLGFRAVLLPENAKTNLKLGRSMFAEVAFAAPLGTLGEAASEIDQEAGYREFIKGSFACEEWTVGKRDRLMVQYKEEAQYAHLSPLVRIYKKRMNTITSNENPFALSQTYDMMLVEEMERIGLDPIVNMDEIPSVMVLPAMRRRAGDLQALQIELEEEDNDDWLDTVEESLLSGGRVYQVDEDTALNALGVNNAGALWTPQTVLARLDHVGQEVEDRNDVSSIYEALQEFLTAGQDNDDENESENDNNNNNNEVQEQNNDNNNDNNNNGNDVITE